MDSQRDARICIVDDDEHVSRLLGDFMAAWGFKSVAIEDEQLATDWFRTVSADVYLVDIRLNIVDGLDLIPKIHEHYPDSKIITITGYVDKESAIRALRLGAFDLMEKPFDPELLHHAICRALEAIEKERNLKKLIADLKQSQSELLSHKQKLEYVNERLLETNRAFSTLARTMDFEREQLEKRIALKIESIILPIVERLRKEQGLSKYEMELDMLSGILRDFLSGASADAKIALLLSPTELRVASLVKSGMTTREIAEQLFISQDTVRTHRKNIRKKLKLNNANYNLRNFLVSKSHATSNN